MEYAAAYHEAGHAVVAKELGASVEGIFVDPNDANLGRARIALTGLPLVNRIQIGLGGPLAEAIWTVESAWNCHVDIAPERVEDLVSIAYEDGILEDLTPVIYFHAREGQTDHFRFRDPNLFSDLEEMCSSGESAKFAREEYAALIRSTIVLLNNPLARKAMRRLAQELIAKGSISGDRFTELTA